MYIALSWTMHHLVTNAIRCIDFLIIIQHKAYASLTHSELDKRKSAVPYSMRYSMKILIVTSTLLLISARSSNGSPGSPLIIGKH